MKRISLRLFLALLTFVIGISFTAFWIFIHNQDSSQDSPKIVISDSTNEQVSTFPLHKPKESNSKNPTEKVVSVTSLCVKLYELKEIPYYPDDTMTGDPIYDGLMEKGKEAISCLVDKITDTTIMPNPGTGPARPKYFRVGDAAVFMLLYITKEQWQPETMLSPEYAKYWESDGIYAYFAYVEKPANRKKIQLWWKDWMKHNLSNQLQAKF